MITVGFSCTKDTKLSSWYIEWYLEKAQWFLLTKINKKFQVLADCSDQVKIVSL